MLRILKAIRNWLLLELIARKSKLKKEDVEELEKKIKDERYEK